MIRCVTGKLKYTSSNDYICHALAVGLKHVNKTVQCASQSSLRYVQYSTEGTVPHTSPVENEDENNSDVKNHTETVNGEGKFSSCSRLFDEDIPFLPSGLDGNLNTNVPKANKVAQNDSTKHTSRICNEEQFCVKSGVPRIKFEYLTRDLTPLDRIYTAQHLSRIIDVLSACGYSKAAVFYVIAFYDIFRDIDADSLQTTLLEHKATENSLPSDKESSSQSCAFPFQKVMDKCYPCLAKGYPSAYLYSDIRLGVLVDSLRSNNVLVDSEEFLKEKGFSNKFIFDFNLLYKTVRKMDVTELQRNVEISIQLLGKLDEDSLMKLLHKRGGKMKTMLLQKLFVCSVDEMLKDEYLMLYFKYKSFCNLVAVFLTLLDNGCSPHEIHKYYFILGYEEGLVKDCLASVKQMWHPQLEPHGGTSDWKSCLENESERLLQQIQMSLEFNCTKI